MRKISIVNGVRTAWSLEGRADAPVVLLANGLGADMTMWEPQLEALGRSYRLLRYDLRGHGDSEATPGDYSLELLSADVLELLRQLDIEKAHFVGCSLGGMVGQYLGARRSGRLASLTLCATSSDAPRDFWQERVEAVRAGGVAPQVEGAIERWFTPAYRSAHPERMDAMRKMILRTAPDGYAGCSAAIRDMALAQTISDIAAPTLVVAGVQDFSTRLPTLEAIAAAIPEAALARVPDAAHMPTIEQADVCNRLILDFLGAVDSKSRRGGAGVG